MAHNLKKRFRKIFLLSLLVFALLLTAIHLLIDYYQNELAQYVIIKLEEKSQGRYSIKVGEVDLDFLMRVITIKNFTLTPQPVAFAGYSNKTTYKSRTLPGTRIKYLKITGISYWHLANDQILESELFNHQKREPGPV